MRRFAVGRACFDGAGRSALPDCIPEVFDCLFFSQQGIVGSHREASWELPIGARVETATELRGASIHFGVTLAAGEQPENGVGPCSDGSPWQSSSPVQYAETL